MCVIVLWSLRFFLDMAVECHLCQKRYNLRSGLKSHLVNFHYRGMEPTGNETWMTAQDSSVMVARREFTVSFKIFDIACNELVVIRYY